MKNAPLNPAEAEQIERNFFAAARPFVRGHLDFPWHRDRDKNVTAGRKESSQALAIEFFETIRTLDSRERIFDAWGRDLDIVFKGPWEIEFEALVPKKLLREPRQTQIDVLAHSDGGIVVFECKFTEADGGACSQPRAITKGPNRGRTQCNGKYELQTNHVNNIRSRCALTGKKIKYWEHVKHVLDFDPETDHSPCPFSGGWYQWMRNLVAARAIGQSHHVPAACVIVYADGAFPMAQKVRSREWAKFEAHARGKEVPLRVVSYQRLGELAHSSATGGDQAVVADLSKWLVDKFASVAGQNNT